MTIAAIEISLARVLILRRTTEVSDGDEPPLT
jgi:hypothetical protein